MTHLCVAITVIDAAQTARDVATAAEAGADLVELRIDRLSDPEQVRSIVGATIVPCIVTCRPTSEGGVSELDDAARAQLLKTAADAGASYVDVELRSLAPDMVLGDTAPREKRAGTIVSAHDFATRPPRLTALLHELNGAPADITKIVWTARTIRDNFEAFEILLRRHKPTIALCMGEAGLISRILAGKFGAFLTFAALGDSEGTAPGQIAVADMKRLYRWDALRASTGVYGVIGSPVMHSLSPAIHNAAFDAIGFDGVYLPLLVEGSYESFKAFMESALALEALDLSGLSVTIPHKENALRWLMERNAEIEDLAMRIGAANTIVIDRRDGAPALRGLNTDYAAILDAITAPLGIERAALKDYRVAVLGAGGTGRTAVAALAACGATVVIYNRTRRRADELAAEFNGRTGKVVAADPRKLADCCCQIYINTTSVGMYPNIDASPLGQAPPKLGPGTLVFDTIYNPMRTRLLEYAESTGATTVGGIEMFVRQAAAQFAAWTGRAAPVQIMRRVIERRLSDVGR